MSKEKEYSRIISKEDYEEEEDAEFNPNESSEEEANEESDNDSSSSSKEEEKEAILNGSIHLSHNEGKLVYNGLWWFASNPTKTQKFRLKSKQSNLKDNFNICNPLLKDNKLKNKRSIWMDGFFFVAEEGDGSRKVKERDLELTFTALGGDDTKNTKASSDETKEEDKSSQQPQPTKEEEELRLSIQGKGCNEFGSFLINGSYTVTPTNKSNNKLICTKAYINNEDDPQRTYTKHSTLQSRFRYENATDEVVDDDDCIVDEETDFDELIALNEEANMSVEELRKRYMGVEEQDVQPRKKVRMGSGGGDESDEEEYGF